VTRTELAVFLHWVETSQAQIAVSYRDRRGSVSRGELADAYLARRAEVAG
jgi:hypothetical protein